jgi:hypothetical protein
MSRPATIKNVLLTSRAGLGHKIEPLGQELSRAGYNVRPVQADGLMELYQPQSPRGLPPKARRTIMQPYSEITAAFAEGYPHAAIVINDGSGFGERGYVDPYGAFVLSLAYANEVPGFVTDALPVSEIGGPRRALAYTVGVTAVPLGGAIDLFSAMRRHR